MAASKGFFLYKFEDNDNLAVIEKEIDEYATNFENITEYSVVLKDGAYMCNRDAKDEVYKFVDKWVIFELPYLMTINEAKQKFPEYFL